jgi:hypothetical protein
MYCPNQPRKYLVWHTEHEFWQPGDLAALCERHASLTLKRIRAGEVMDCDLLATEPDFDDEVRCSWNLHWPLVDELKTIVLA